MDSGGLHAYVFMSKIKGGEFGFHLSEQQLVEYVQQDIVASDLQIINLHLLECFVCAERLSLLILFAAENHLLQSEQERVIDRFLTSPDYDSLKGSFISRAIERYKRGGSRLLKRVTPRRFSTTFSFSLER